MTLPNNIKLPFFDYGLFKPGQICYFRIKEFVLTRNQDTVDGYLKERDGIPVLVHEKNHDHIKGYIIHFREGKEEEAYQRIVDIEPQEVYKWETITLHSGKEANVLHGRKVDRGSVDYEHCNNWDGRSDPYFTDAIELVEEILKQNETYGLDFKKLFNLQMAYFLLWTSIERYTGLRYHLGQSVMEKIKQMAKEESFVTSVKKNVTKEREVYSANNLSKIVLDPNNPQKAISYYYQVRSNSTHRGKAAHQDFDTVLFSLRELLAIFKDVLKESFKDM